MVSARNAAFDRSDPRRPARRGGPPRKAPEAKMINLESRGATSTSRDSSARRSGGAASRRTVRLHAAHEEAIHWNSSIERCAGKVVTRRGGPAGGVSDMLRSCDADPFGVNTCDHVWEDSLNAANWRAEAPRRSKTVLRWKKVPGWRPDRGPLRDFGSSSWYTVGYELAARLTMVWAPNGEDITAT